MKTKINYNILGFCLINIAFLLFYIIPTIGGQVYTKCARYHVCSRYLRSSGWPFYYTTDHADNQWKDIRNNFPLLWCCLISISTGHYIIRAYFCNNTDVKHKNNENNDNNEKMLQKNAHKSSCFRVLVGLIFLFVMHKWHMYIILVIALVTFQLAMSLKSSSYGKLIIWIFALCLLGLKECYRIKYWINIPVCISSMCSINMCSISMYVLCVVVCGCVHA